MDEFARWTSGIKRFGDDRNSIKKGIRISEEENDHCQCNPQERALQGTNDAQCFTLSPGRTPQESDGSQNGAAQSPHEDAARAAHKTTRSRNTERHEAKRSSAAAAEQKVAAESKYHQPIDDEHI